MNAKKEKERQRIIKGIAGYQEMQHEIRQAIRDHGGKLTEEEFDEEFGKPDRPLTCCKMTGASFLLFSAMPGPQQEYLQLTHYMMAIGIIETSTENDLVTYREGKNYRKEVLK